MGLPVFPGAPVMPAHEGHNQAAAQPKLKSKIAAIARQATRIGELGGALAETAPSHLTSKQEHLDFREAPPGPF